MKTTFKLINTSTLFAFCFSLPFSFYTLAQAPGGVSSGLTSWFKAGSLGTGSVSAWSSSVGSTTVNSGGGSTSPVCFSFATNPTSSAEVNFNKGVYFDGSNDNLENNSVTGLLGQDGTVFLAHRVDGSLWNTAFASKEFSNNSEYQIKPVRVGFTKSFGDWWQIDQTYFTPPSSNVKMRITGFQGKSLGSEFTDFNGNVSTTKNANNAGALVSANLSFGSDGTSQYSNSTITEVITYNRNLTNVEMNKIDAYLAIKYGVTLGVNGTSKDYVNSSNTVVWDASTNTGYANDIAGIARDDNSTLDQRKSHSVNGLAVGNFSDIVTIANGATFSTPSSFSADNSFFMWGHNGGPLVNTGAYVNITTENGVLIETIFSRVWKAQESGTVNNVNLQFNLTGVMGAFNITSNNELANLRLLIDEDGNFNSGAFALTPSSFSNATQIANFVKNFIVGNGSGRGFYFTIGSINAVQTPLSVELLNFNAVKNGSNVDLFWKTASEQNTDYFEVYRSKDGSNWEFVCKKVAAGNSNIEKSYNDVDRAPYSGISYYRLKEIDLEGQVKWHNIVSVNIKSKAILLYPNPSEGNLTIKLFTANEGEQVAIQILSQAGQIVYEKSFVVKKGENNIFVNANHLTNGLYHTKIIKSDGNVEIIKLEIQK